MSTVVLTADMTFGSKVKGSRSRSKMLKICPWLVTPACLEISIFRALIEFVV